MRVFLMSCAAQMVTKRDLSSISSTRLSAVSLVCLDVCRGQRSAAICHQNWWRPRSPVSPSLPLLSLTHTLTHTFSRSLSPALSLHPEPVLLALITALPWKPVFGYQNEEFGSDLKCPPADRNWIQSKIYSKKPNRRYDEKQKQKLVTLWSDRLLRLKPTQTGFIEPGLEPDPGWNHF